MSKVKKHSILSRNLLIPLVLLLVLGWLILAILDQQYRDSFVKLAEFSVGCFIGWTMPNPKYRGKE